MSRNLILVALVAVLGAGAWLTLAPQTNAPNRDAQAQALLGAANAQTAEEIDTSSVLEMTLGNPDAPVTVIEYASYTCPHCATWHSGPLKQLKAEYIDTGKIQFIYREVYFDRYGLWASAIARCAGTPAAFFGISDLVYASQSEWTRAGEPVAIVDELRKIGLKAGLGREQVEACLNDQDKLRTLVAWYQKNADADGIRSTPSFVINGQTYNNMAFDEMARLIDEAADS